MAEAETKQKLREVGKAMKKPRPESERLAIVIAGIKRIGAASYMAGDKAKAERCEAAIVAINAIG